MKWIIEMPDGWDDKQMTLSDSGIAQVLFAFANAKKAMEINHLEAEALRANYTLYAVEE